MELEFAKPKELIHTVCQGCVFRVEDEKRDQVGCIVEVDKLAVKKEHVYDFDGNGFYLMDGHLCLHKRNEKWFNNTKIDGGKSNAFEDMDNARKLVLAEVEKAKMTYSLVIVCNQDFTEENFKEKIEEIKNQTIQFTEVLFIIYSKNYPKQSWMYNHISEHFKGKWKITKSNSQDKNVILDEQIKTLKSIYYVVINIEDKLSDNFVEKLQESIKKERFFAIEPINDKNSYLCVMNFVHYALGGNKEAVTTPEYGEECKVNGVIDKIKFVLKDHQKENYVTTYEKLGITP
jgi:hypothetical protein